MNCGICNYNNIVGSKFCGHCGNTFGKQMNVVNGNFIIGNNNTKPKCLRCGFKDANDNKKLCQECYVNMRCISCKVNNKSFAYDYCQDCYVNHKFTFTNNNNNIVCPRCNVKQVTKGFELCKGCYLITKNINNNKMLVKHIDSGCSHNTCKMCKLYYCYNSCFVLPLVKRNNSIYCWLGLENSGMYKDQCNLIGGKGEEIDKINGNMCWLNIISRESTEEVKCNFNINDNDSYIIYNKNPVFLVRLDDTVTRVDSQQRMDIDNNNKKLPCHMREMRYVACVNIYDLTHIDNGIDYPISSFAKGLLNEVSKLDLKYFNF